MFEIDGQFELLGPRQMMVLVQCLPEHLMINETDMHPRLFLVMPQPREHAWGMSPLDCMFSMHGDMQQRILYIMSINLHCMPRTSWLLEARCAHLEETT